MPGHRFRSFSAQRCRSSSGLRENTPPALSEGLHQLPGRTAKQLKIHFQQQRLPCAQAGRATAAQGQRLTSSANPAAARWCGGTAPAPGREHPASRILHPASCIPPAAGRAARCTATARGAGDCETCRLVCWAAVSFLPCAGLGTPTCLPYGSCQGAEAAQQELMSIPASGSFSGAASTPRGQPAPPPGGQPCSLDQALSWAASKGSHGKVQPLQLLGQRLWLQPGQQEPGAPACSEVARRLLRHAAAARARVCQMRLLLRGL